jgi:hypothetical protein
MSRYSRVTLNPTEGQLADLSMGEAVRLSPHHYDGQIPLHLTASQIKKIQTAAQAGKGCTLKFSRAQIAYSIKNGGGLFKDIVKGGIRLVAPYASEYAQKGVGKLVDMASESAQGLVGDGVQRGSGWLGDVGRFVGHTAVDGIATALGQGVQIARKNPPPPKKNMQGAGWLGDVGRFVGHSAVDGLASALGGSIVQQQMAQPGLFQKKIRGQGLYQ